MPQAGDAEAEFLPNTASMTKSTKTLQARLDVLEAAVVALAASLPPERADFARRIFAVAVTELDERLERDAAADAAASGAAAAVVGALPRAGAGRA